MKLTTDIHYGKGMRFVCKTFECCGNRWELLISKRTFKRRASWRPTCPNCKSSKVDERNNKLKTPLPKPRYDDVFFEGLEWMNKL